MKLSNFIRQCSCGKNMAFHDTEQKIQCPQCHQIIQLPTSVKQYLITQPQIIHNKQTAEFSLN